MVLFLIIISTVGGIVWECVVNSCGSGKASTVKIVMTV
jgi:hypothetical protein